MLGYELPMDILGYGHVTKSGHVSAIYSVPTASKYDFQFVGG